MDIKVIASMKNSFPYMQWSWISFGFWGLLKRSKRLLLISAFEQEKEKQKNKERKETGAQGHGKRALRQLGIRETNSHVFRLCREAFLHWRCGQRWNGWIFRFTSKFARKSEAFFFRFSPFWHLDWFFFFLVKVLFVFMILLFLQLYPSMLLRFLC